MNPDTLTFGVAPRLLDVTPTGDVAYTHAGACKAAGLSKAGGYRTKWFMALRRGFGDNGGAPWRWLKSELDAAMRERQRDPRYQVSPRAALPKLAQVGKAKFAKKRKLPKEGGLTVG